MTDDDSSRTIEGQREAEPEAKGAKESFLKNIWVQRIGLSLLIICVVAGWQVYRRGWWFLLPRLPAFESVRQDDRPARRLAEALGIPTPPDLTKIEEDSARNFYVALHNVRKYTRTARNYGILGRVYEAEGLHEKALALYRRAIELDENDYAWHYHAGLVAQHLNRSGLARSHFQHAVKLNPNYAPAYMRLGDLALRARELDEAESMFKAYLAQRPSDVAGELSLARLARERGDWQGVVDQVNAARQLGEIGKSGHGLLSLAYHHLGDNEQSKAELQLALAETDTILMEDTLENRVRALQTSKDAVASRYNLLFEQGRYHEALELAGQLKDKTVGQPDHAAAWVRVAECHRLLGENDEALAAIAEALKLAPMEPEPHCIHGLIRIAFRDLTRAFQEAERAIALNSDYTPAYLLRGQTLLNLAVQDPDQLKRAGITRPPRELVRLAIADLRRVSELESAPFEVLSFLGLGLAMDEKYDQAAEIFERTLELKPDHPGGNRLLTAARARDASVFWPGGPPAEAPATRAARDEPPGSATQPGARSTTRPARR